MLWTTCECIANIPPSVYQPSNICLGINSSRPTCYTVIPRNVWLDFTNKSFYSLSGGFKALAEISQKRCSDSDLCRVWKREDRRMFFLTACVQLGGHSKFLGLLLPMESVYKYPAGVRVTDPMFPQQPWPISATVHWCTKLHWWWCTAFEPNVHPSVSSCQVDWQLMKCKIAWNYLKVFVWIS